MRREGVYKLLLNGYVTKEMNIERVGERMLRFQLSSYTEEHQGAASFLVKVPRDVECTELYNCILSVQKKFGGGAE